MASAMSSSGEAAKGSSRGRMASPQEGSTPPPRPPSPPPRPRPRLLGKPRRHGPIERLAHPQRVEGGLRSEGARTPLLSQRSGHVVGEGCGGDGHGHGQRRGGALLALLGGEGGGPLRHVGGGGERAGDRLAVGAGAEGCHAAARSSTLAGSAAAPTSTPCAASDPGQHAGSSPSRTARRTAASTLTGFALRRPGAPEGRRARRRR